MDSNLITILILASVVTATIIIIYLTLFFVESEITYNTKIVVEDIKEMTGNVLNFDEGITPIICVLKWGLGNRISCLASSILLSKYLNSPLYVVWTDAHMGNVKISDIWQEPYPFIVLDRIPKSIKGLISWSPPNQIGDRSNNELITYVEDIPNKILKSNIIITSTWWSFKHRDLDLKYFTNERRNEINNSLIPTQTIQELINKYTNNFDNNTIGAHIRSTDSCKVLWGSFEKCEQLGNNIKIKIRLMMDDNPSMKLFICTDDPKYVEDLIDEYKHRIIIPNLYTNRFTLSGQEEAYAEMVALSKCNHLILSSNSTFSGVASYLANIFGDNCNFYSPTDKFVCN